MAARSGESGNAYTQALGAIYDECPKAILAAVAVHMLTEGGMLLPDAPRQFAEAWLMLHTRGMVRQRPFGMAAQILKGLA